ncbi:MAG: DMT family transporter [Ignavibacteriaceae bacterium]|nr:DMT family transporter [Ignavibacteriaceae bacterium]
MPVSEKEEHFKAILQALLVTFLWSTSFIIIKFGLKEIPPLTFAGLRYFLAFIFLLPLLLRKKYFDEIKNLGRKEYPKLILYGFVFIGLTQGAQFAGLSLLPSVIVSLMLNFTPMVVAVMGYLLLSEKPTTLQWFGAVLFLGGVIIYFLPVNLTSGEWLGLIIMTFGILANAGSSILGRQINRQRLLSPLVITIISIGVGSVFLLIAGLAIQGISSISLLNIVLLFWMAGVNTAYAFTLWNKTLRSLTAMESSIINGTMLIQIGVLAWVFLGEAISLKEGLGMIVAMLGAVLVQIKLKKIRYKFPSSKQ